MATDFFKKFFMGVKSILILYPLIFFAFYLQLLVAKIKKKLWRKLQIFLFGFYSLQA